MSDNNSDTKKIPIRELADIEKNIFVNYIRTPMIQGNLSPQEQKKEVQTCIENIIGLLSLLLSY